MFREKCSRCNKKIKKGYDFCPYCGNSLKEDGGDYGFLGKRDTEEGFDQFGLPFGFNMLLKPLMRELPKLMSELDKELKEDSGQERGSKTGPHTRKFTIHIGRPGQKPIKIQSGNKNLNQINRPKKNALSLPKISTEESEDVKKLPRKEPETNVRRLSNKIIYELELPGVNSIENIGINKLETGLEVKAISEKQLFSKFLEVNLPLMNYSFRKGKLVLELGLEK